MCPSLDVEEPVIPMFRARSLCLAGVGVFCLPMGAVETVSGVECGAARILCVDDTPTAEREYESIQAAVDDARRGDTVMVFPGRYAGFRVTRSGTRKRPIVIQAFGRARVVDPAAGDDRGIHLSRVSYVEIRDFVVSAARMRQGIAASDATANNPMRGLMIVGNEVSGARSTNIYLSQVADSLVAGNTASGSRESHGIYLANAGSDGTELRGNRCFGNAKNGIHLNGDARVGGDGVHTDVIADGNVLHDNAANGFDLDGVRESTFVNNVAYDNGRHGPRAFAIDAAAGPARLVIANNTFVDNAGWAIKLTQDDGGHRVFNNTMLSDAGGLAVDAGLRADYNVAAVFSLDGDTTLLDLEQWQAAGRGANSFVASRTALFQRANKSDYHLRKTSPALDAGTRRFGGEAAPELDADRLPRPDGAAYDIGAYERDTQAKSR